MKLSRRSGPREDGRARADFHWVRNVTEYPDGDVMTAELQTNCGDEAQPTWCYSLYNWQYEDTRLRAEAEASLFRIHQRQCGCDATDYMGIDERIGASDNSADREV